MVDCCTCVCDPVFTTPTTTDCTPPLLVFSGVYTRLKVSGYNVGIGEGYILWYNRWYSVWYTVGEQPIPDATGNEAAYSRQSYQFLLRIFPTTGSIRPDP